MKIYQNSIRVILTIILGLTSTGFGNFPTPAQEPTPGPEIPALLAPDFPIELYLPFISYTNTSDVDLSIAALEPTQTIQTNTNSVQLITNRPTILRIYTKTDNGSAARNVRISLSATRGGATLSSSPLVVGPGTVPSAWSRGDLNTSFNARLPQAWLSGQVTVRVTLDSNNAISEKNEGNNTTSIVLNFVSTPTLDVKVVPINYSDPGGLTYPPANTDFLRPGLMKLYPVAQASITSRTAIQVTCDLSSDSCWDGLLDYITALKRSDVAPPSQFYYGLIPLRDASNHTWFFGGTAGYGWVGRAGIQARTAIGLADWVDYGIDGGLIAAHEIGHNLGRGHAPCGVTGDNSYPYAGGSIGHYGLDIDLVAVRPPNTYSDVMGYCNEQWVSDYTYTGLMTGLQTGVGAGPYPSTLATGLMVRGALDGSGHVSLESAYTFAGYIDEPAAPSEYAVEFLDESGQVVGSYPITVLHAGEPGIETQRINSMVPIPEQAFASYRLTRAGEILAQRDLTAQKDSAAVEAPVLSTVGENLVISRDRSQSPAIVRYTLDGSQTWTTLALDWPGGDLMVPLATLPSGNLQFQIISADSFGQSWTFDWNN